MSIKQVLKKIPVISSVARCIYRTWINPPTPFQGSEEYWKDRYEAGGHSGDGSYNQLAEFKTATLLTASVTALVQLKKEAQIWNLDSTQSSRLKPT